MEIQSGAQITSDSDALEIVARIRRALPLLPGNGPDAELTAKGLERYLAAGASCSLSRP
jgi:hypothetical protein